MKTKYLTATKIERDTITVKSDHRDRKGNIVKILNNRYLATRVFGKRECKEFQNLESALKWSVVNYDEISPESLDVIDSLNSMDIQVNDKRTKVPFNGTRSTT